MGHACVLTCWVYKVVAIERGERPPGRIVHCHDSQGGGTVVLDLDRLYTGGSSSNTLLISHKKKDNIIVQNFLRPLAVP